MILFEHLVTAGQLLASNMRAENDLFLNPVYIILLHCKLLHVRALSAFGWSNTVWTCPCTYWSQLEVWFFLTCGIDWGRKAEHWIDALLQRQETVWQLVFNLSMSIHHCQPSLSQAYTGGWMIENNSMKTKMCWEQSDHIFRLDQNYSMHLASFFLINATSIWMFVCT